MIKFKTIRWKNFLSTGEVPNEMKLDQHFNTLIVGKNGSGKCLKGSTEIEISINNKEVEKKFLEFLDERRKKEEN